MAIHSSILSWEITCTEEPGGLQSMGWQSTGHGWMTNTHFFILFQCVNYKSIKEPTALCYLYTLWFVKQLPKLIVSSLHTEDFPGGSDGKESTCNEGLIPGLIPGLERSPGEGNGKPLQYSCLENPVDSGALWATVHGVTKSGTQLSDSCCYIQKLECVSLYLLT